MYVDLSFTSKWGHSTYDHMACFDHNFSSVNAFRLHQYVSHMKCLHFNGRLQIKNIVNMSVLLNSRCVSSTPIFSDLDTATWLFIYNARTLYTNHNMLA